VLDSLHAQPWKLLLPLPCSTPQMLVRCSYTKAAAVALDPASPGQPKIRLSDHCNPCCIVQTVPERDFYHPSVVNHWLRVRGRASHDADKVVSDERLLSSTTSTALV
jgi:hypothetical protein